MKRQYYSLVTVGDTATINIYGDITSFPWSESDVSSYNLSKQLDDMQGVKQLDVYINSYGGEVAEGLAIYNALKRKAKSAKVTTYCDGFACSIASVIFMAGTERKMSSASLLMIHNAWTIGEGNAAELRKVADDLDIITGASIEAYKEKASISEKKIRALMDAESWITPKDAVKYGFATEIIEETSENPSQNVRISLMDVIMAAKSADTDDLDDSEDNLEDEDEKPVDAVTSDDNGEETVDDEQETEEQDEETSENEEKTEDDDEPSEQNQQNATQKMSGFFNAILKI
jgi:ATP-dependent Clp endopeptidase proteolytic subunit ClpP